MPLVGGDAERGWIYGVEVEIHEPSQYFYAFSANDGVHEIFQAVGKTTVKRLIEVAPMPTPTPEKGVPGFEAVFTIAGLLAVAYLLKIRKEGI